MANLSFIDKQLIEDVLGMGGGYVLDFSNRTFDEFMTEVIENQSTPSTHICQRRTYCASL